MNLAEAFTSDLLAELRRLRRRWAEATPTSSPSRELERGIREIERELRRRGRYS